MPTDRISIDALVDRVDFNLLLSTGPLKSDVYPDSSIRKYRAAYYGPRSSERINLLQQEVLSDLSYCYNKLINSEDSIENILYSTSHLNIPRY